jgi:hypothetical protein
LGWIGKLLGFANTPVGQQFGATIFGDRIGKKMPKYLGWLQWLEQGKGANTKVWSRIVDAKRANQSITLSAEEVDYLCTFKKGWDKFLKKPLNKVAEQLNLSEIAEDVAEGQAIGEALTVAVAVEESYDTLPDDEDEPLDDDEHTGGAQPVDLSG